MFEEIKKVGIDLDNTLSELNPTLKMLSEYYNKPIMTIEDVKDYNLSSIYGVNHEESRKFWSEVEHEICEKSELATLRFESIYSNFVQKDTKVYIITNRHEKYREITENWLKINAIPYDKLVMTSGKSKIPILKGLNIDWMIDDKPHLFHEVVEKNVKTKMVCVDYEYNKGVPCHIRMTREGEILYDSENYQSRSKY